MTTAYINGAIYTVGPGSTWADTMIVGDDGVILAVGSAETLLDLADEADSVTDLEGRMVMPGIHDAHTHLVSGLGAFEVAFPIDSDEEAIVEALRAWPGPLPIDAKGNGWLIGGRYWPEHLTASVPDKEFLDRAFPDTPVLLNDRTAHNVLVNSKALELAGIEASYVPHQGSVVVDGAGHLTGELLDQARWPLYRVIGRHSADTMAEAVRWAVGLCHRFGITSVQDASSTQQLLATLGSLDETNELRLNVAAHLVWHEEAFGMMSLDELEALIEARDSWSSAHVDTRFVKIWIDGSPVGPTTTEAFLHADGSIERSRLLVDRSELLDALVRFDAEGLTVKMHCGGDGAVREALDAIENARRVNGPTGPRHELAHLYRIDSADLERFAPLGAVAEMSPAVWHIPEQGVQDGYDFRDVVRSGAEMTFGTDWSVTETPNLFPALQGTLEHGDQAIGLPEALAALTINGARAVRAEGTRGSLEAGKSADFIVLDRNLFEIPISEVGATEVISTYFEGRKVYERA